MAGLTSASSFISLLHDNEVELQVHALNQLDALSEQFWAEIADSLPRIEEISEDEKFPAREKAALVASKVYYHLGTFGEAMNYALGAGTLFDLSEDSEYVSTLIAKCVDEYARLRREHLEKEAAIKARGQTAKQEDNGFVIDPKLEAIVERLFVRCLQDGENKQALGIAIESMRLDYARKAILESDNVKEMLSYAFTVCMNLVLHRDFRCTVLELLVSLYEQSHVSDYMNMCRCLTFLGRSVDIAKVIHQLLKDEKEDATLLAFQIAFELVDNATQQFLTSVRESLPPAPEEQTAQKTDAMQVDSEEVSESIFTKNLRTLHKIIEGEPAIRFYLEFLYRNNKADLVVLKKIKSLFEPRVSVLHTGTIIANAIMHCGTTRDTFLRDNLEWLSRTINWAKFTTTAGLGAIHKGHIKEAYTVLDPYLPKPGVTASPYSEGGSLYAFGLIHANHGHGRVTEYLLEQLRNIDLIPQTEAAGGGGGSQGSLDAAQKKEIVQHGAALGLGVAAMASGNEEVFQALLDLIYHNDSAIAGEAAGLAMGLVMLGTATEYSKEMLNFAHATQHEKIIRSLGLGLALIMYGLEEKADMMIETLNSDKDPILRYGGQFTIGLAYCGTANNKAIRQLLHVAVSDVSDDVRRAAVISLGFVLFRQPEQVPRLVSLLSESYNPHVRYGAAIALGIACAGTGMKEAIALLEPMTKDSVSFVRQGAFIALAMILIQISEKAEPKVKEIRQLFLDTIGDKHQSVMAKLGAIIALGVIDGGGRNCTIALSSRSGHMNMSAAVGLMVFVQYWYWYPFFLFISLAFTPTAIIGVNLNLEMPKFKIKSNARPSLFAYPPEILEPKEEKKTALPTAQLSITKKQQQRQEKKKQQQDKEKKSDPEKEEEDKMEVVTEPSTESTDPDKKKEEEEKKEKPEPEFELLDNPARVTRAQLKFITFDLDPRYVPILEGVHGVVLLKDTKPHEKEDIIEPGVPKLFQQVEEEEPECPESFEFLG